MGGILSIIHPELYTVGIASLKLLNQDSNSITKGDRLAAVLREWSSPLMAITTISNRDTSYHRDNRSAHPWFDMLLALGEYQQGIRFKYDLGAVVALAGRILRDGAACPGD